MNQLKVWQFVEKMPEDEAITHCSTTLSNIYGFGHQELLKDAIRCIQENRRSMIDGLEGQRSLEIISAIYESVERRQEVFVSFTLRNCRLGEHTEHHDHGRHPSH